MIKDDIKNIKTPIIILIPYIVITQFIFGTVCPFKILTGINCPACGLTHAVIYLILGRFHDSFHANPTGALWLISILLFIFDRYIHKLNKNIVSFMFIIVAVITFLVYIVNMLIYRIY